MAHSILSTYSPPNQCGDASQKPLPLLKSKLCHSYPNIFWFMSLHHSVNEMFIASSLDGCMLSVSAYLSFHFCSAERMRLNLPRKFLSQYLQTCWWIHAAPPGLRAVNFWMKEHCFSTCKLLGRPEKKDKKMQSCAKQHWEARTELHFSCWPQSQPYQGYGSSSVCTAGPPQLSWYFSGWDQTCCIP